MTDAQKANPKLSVTLLRYFNPIGAHESGIMGEDPKGIPNNLLPYIAQVAVGKLEKFTYSVTITLLLTVQAFVTISTLLTLQSVTLRLLNIVQTRKAYNIYNLCTGNGYSVLDIVKAFSKACGKEIPYQIDPRRPGDIAECYADPAKAKAELGWEAKRGIDEMCADSWRWQSTHPDGFGE